MPTRERFAAALGAIRRENTIASGCKLMVDRTDATRPRWYLEFVG
jgi:hypothetical protein